MDSLVVDTLIIKSNIANSGELIYKILPTIITLIIAIAAVFIAYLQWRTNQLKVRHELFEKRVKVYEATFKFIQLVIAKARPSKDDIYELIENTKLSKFLFKEEISNYVAELRDKGNELIRIDLEINKLRRKNVEDESKWKEVTDKDFEVFDWFIKQFTEIEKLFLEYIDLSKK